MGGNQQENSVKRSVSFSLLVNQWAEEMARERGFENNFSGFIASLIREARERDAAARTAPPSRRGVIATLRKAAKTANG